MTEFDSDQFYMKRALRLAVLGAGNTSPNPMVGAVLVKDGVIAGQGYHEVLGGPHAEVNAIADAGERARGATLYVTLEPCNHHGLTPPCTRAVIEAGISRVVFGMADPNPEVAGGGAAYLAERGIKVRGGVLECECRSRNQPFIKRAVTGLPYITLKAAATLDGFIATSAGDSKWITSERSRKFAHKLRSMADAILVGIGTVLADDPLLTARLPGKKIRRQPIRIILDTELKLPVESRLVKTAGITPVWAICSESASKERERILTAAGVQVLRIPAGKGSVGIDIPGLLSELGKRHLSSLLVEGGGHVLGSFMESGLADEFYFFYAPKILADPGGISMVRGRQRIKIAESVQAYGIKTRRFGEDLLISGRLREKLY
ncbi:MAG: bifunctional diaminohydroxyphosphoribosylaminopyrimidine deaminase/5-amino-6-(5-phosphoribosylamino)uracil reductase RibD [Syntrophobacteraceae bacterium]